ncbi:MAG: helix-turn-helix domain-containing protein [Egibacteraceae bacterium]
MNDDMGVGQRIRYWRKRRGMSQRTLAELAGRSTSWLEKVEAGERVCDRAPVLIAIANILKIEVGDLLGQPFKLPPNGGGPHDPPNGIPALRRALLAVDPPDLEPRPAAELRAELEDAKRRRHAGRYESLAVGVPQLLTDARAAAVRDLPDDWWCLAGTYQVAAAVLRTVGEVELSWIAADRAIAAAQRSGDDYMVSVSESLIMFALLRQGMVDEAGAVCSNAADRLAPTAASGLAAWTLWGSKKLFEAVIAARRSDAGHAYRVLRDAGVAAERVGPGPKPYWAAFGPANVSAMEAVVALELGDPSEAVRVAGRLDIDELASPERRADVCIHVAHAYSLRHDDPATVAMLLDAERHGPEEVRYSVKAHDLVRVCLKRERKSATPGLRDLAGRLGVRV